MSFVNTVLAFVVALGVLIVVHEYGHYIVARLCGVKVLRFSVGFGRPLAMWRRGRDRTEWVIAAVPFGGYVKMLDEREGAVPPEEAHRAFNRQSVWRRFAIVVAGPLFNFAFAILVYAGLFMYGLPEARPVLGEPPAGTPAATAGLKSGDTVRAAQGEPIETWQELRWRTLQAALQRAPLRLELQNERGHVRDATLDLSRYPADEVETDALEHIGLRLYRPPLEPVIGQVVSGGPAERAGLAAGDRIVRAGGQPHRHLGGSGHGDPRACRPAACPPRGDRRQDQERRGRPRQRGARRCARRDASARPRRSLRRRPRRC